ncbi:ribbon-helix-helix domain-containing protein [Streptococcus salivarius]
MDFKRFSSAPLKETSEETMIPQAKIVQKAIEKQLKEMGK